MIPRQKASSTKASSPLKAPKAKAPPKPRPTSRITRHPALPEGRSGGSSTVQLKLDLPVNPDLTSRPPVFSSTCRPCCCGTCLALSSELKAHTSSPQRGEGRTAASGNWPSSGRSCLKVAGESRQWQLPRTLKASCSRQVRELLQAHQEPASK